MKTKLSLRSGVQGREVVLHMDTDGDLQIDEVTVGLEAPGMDRTTSVWIVGGDLEELRDYLSEVLAEDPSY